MRAQYTFMFLCAVAGCIDSEPTETALDQGTEDLPLDDMTADMSEVELPVVDEPPDVIAAGLHRLMALDFNLQILRVGCWSGHTLDWSCASNQDGIDTHMPFKHRVLPNHTEVADMHGGFDGECVSLVKSAAHSNVVTGDWHPGVGVFAGGLAAGTSIATFPGGHYFGHAAIFLAHIRNSAGDVVGIRVADQNWGGRFVHKHVIFKGSGGGVTNANNFHAILVD